MKMDEQQPREVRQVKVKFSDLILPERNANEMSNDEFGRLCESIEEDGLVELPQVIPAEEEWKYLVVWWNHRAKAMNTLYWPDVEFDVVVLDTIDSETEAKAKSVRMNVIRWKINPAKFTKMVNDLSKEWMTNDEIKEMMSIDDKEFEKYYLEVKRQLPKDIQEKLEKSKKEIKTIDDLSRVLNDIYSKHGDTVPLWYMAFNFGGNNHILIECDKEMRKHIADLTKFCEEKQIPILNVLNPLFQTLNYSDLMDKWVKWA